MKIFISLLFIISFSISAFAQTYISMRPNWTFNPPKAENSTYEYYVSRGVGTTEKEARTDAFVIAVKEAQQRVGVGANSSEIFSAFQSNQDFNVIANYYEIPMKEVCSFSEKTRDGSQWYYYQLLQIAINGSITPDFRQFTGDCYDFSKAKELREIMKEEYKEHIEADKKAQERESKQKKLEEYKQYDISYAEFCYKINEFYDKPATGYLLERSDKVKKVGHYLWTIPPLVAFGVGMGVGLAVGESDPVLACAIIFPVIAASMLPSILCYASASSYKKKAWKAYRQPYDNAARKIVTIHLSPSVGYNWAGVGMRIRFN